MRPRTLRRQIRASARALRSRPLRVFLAVATIAAGVAVMIVTGAISAGVRRQVAARLEQVGTNLLVVRPAAIVPTVARPAVRGSATTLTTADAEALREVTDLDAVAPGSDRRVRARSAIAAAPASVLGTTTAFERIRNITLASGRFLTPIDEAEAARVAVLGSRIARVLFGGGDAVGGTVMLGRVPFDVIGVLQSKGAGADGSDQDGQVLVPVTTAMRRLNNVTWLSEIFVRARRQEDLEGAQRAVVAALTHRHRSLDFEVQNTAALVASRSQTAESLDVITEGVALITFTIGGGGIVALMLLATTERTTEIGLRIAVGASPSDVVLQFMTEAIALSAGGWLLGIITGAVAVSITAAATQWSIGVPIETIVSSLILSVSVGVAGGVLPARRASRVPPMQALLSQ